MSKSLRKLKRKRQLKKLRSRKNRRSSKKHSVMRLGSGQKSSSPCSKISLKKQLKLLFYTKFPAHFLVFLNQSNLPSPRADKFAVGTVFLPLVKLLQLTTMPAWVAPPRGRPFEILRMGQEVQLVR